MSKTDLSLWRCALLEFFPAGVVIDGSPAPGVLFPDFHPRPLPNGRTRLPDIPLEPDEAGIDRVNPGRGTSLFDRPRVFSDPKVWLSFKIPIGTEVPASIRIVNTGYNKRHQATHYQIEPASLRMRVDAYKGALDNLARNAVVRAVQLGTSIED